MSKRKIGKKQPKKEKLSENYYKNIIYSFQKKVLRFENNLLCLELLNLFYAGLLLFFAKYIEGPIEPIRNWFLIGTAILALIWLGTETVLITLMKLVREFNIKEEREWQRKMKDEN